MSYYLDENKPASTDQVESAKTEVLHHYNSYYTIQDLENQDLHPMNPTSITRHPAMVET